MGAADQVLDTGDTVLFQAHAPHRYACAGDEPVRFVMVVLQPGDAGLVPPTAIAEAERRIPAAEVPHFMTASLQFRYGESPILETVSLRCRDGDQAGPRAAAQAGRVSRYCRNTDAAVVHLAVGLEAEPGDGAVGTAAVRAAR